ncbi:MAG: hypothetical protein ACM3VV_05430 [Deltaproteobacteria bacterium]
MYSKNPLNEKLINFIESSGYIYGNQKTDIVIREIILNVLQRIGKSYSKALIYQICNLYGLSQNELLSNYELFEKSITRVLGKTGFPIILRIKKELLKYLVLNKLEISIKDILDPSFNVPEIINKLVESNNYELISEILNKRNHIIFLLYSNDKYIEKIIKNLVQVSKGTTDIRRVVIRLHDHFDEKRYFESESDDIDIFYLDDTASSNKSIKINNINFINFEEFHKSNILVFCFIDTQILNLFNNYENLKKIENKLEKLYNLNENIQICCIYDMSNTYPIEYEIKLLKDFINHHNVVILDEPFLIYQKFDIRKDVLK